MGNETSPTMAENYGLNLFFLLTNQIPKTIFLIIFNVISCHTILGYDSVNYMVFEASFTSSIQLVIVCPPTSISFRSICTLVK